MKFGALVHYGFAQPTSRPRVYSLEQLAASSGNASLIATFARSFSFSYHVVFKKLF